LYFSTGGSCMDNEEEAESEMKLSDCEWVWEELQYLRSQIEGDREQQQLQMVYLCRQNQNLAISTQHYIGILSAGLQEKDRLIQSLQHQLRMQVPRMHQCSDSEMSDRLSNEGTTSFHDSPPAGRRQTPNRPHTGLKVTNGDAFSDMRLGSGGVADEGGVADGEEGSVEMLQQENSHLQEQLRSSEELNATLRSELDLTRSILKHNPQKTTEDKQSEHQNTSTSKTINSDLLAEHLQEIRALRQRLEETIRTNERLREQLERKLQEAEKDSAATNIFIAGSEDRAHISSELHFLLTQNHTLKEQLNQGARAVDLSELLAEIRQLRVQLERSIQINTTLRQRLEQQLLTRTDPRSTININYLLPKTDEAGKSDVLHSHTDVSSAAHDSSSSVDSGSHVPSRLVPGHRLWADRRGRHVLGLIEDYNALRKQIGEAKRVTADLDTQIHDCGRAVDQLKSVSGGVNTIQQALEEAARLLKLLWRVSVPSGDATHTQQEDLLKSEISRLKTRLSQQERMLSGAVKRLRSTNHLKEGMERIIIDQLSLTHGVLKRARGNLEVRLPLCLFPRIQSSKANQTFCSSWRNVSPFPLKYLS
ncbi:hypothetical protein cypCar_00032851, partial [Cyprinus carpio]